MTISLFMKNEVTLQNLADFENKSLLIVDDDNPFRERLARAMEKKGFEVIQAEGVQKGIDSVKAKKPGFAVVDLRLGDGNGLEVVKQIQTSNSESRIIMLTGYGNIPTAVAATGKQPDFQRFPILVKASEAEKNYGIDGPSANISLPIQASVTGLTKRIEAQKVYIGSIDRNVTQAQLYSIFSQFGDLEKVTLQVDTATGMSKGFAFLCFKDPKVANLAIQAMSGQVLAGRPL